MVGCRNDGTAAAGTSASGSGSAAWTMSTATYGCYIIVIGMPLLHHLVPTLLFSPPSVCLPFLSTLHVYGYLRLTTFYFYDRRLHYSSTLCSSITTKEA